MILIESIIQQFRLSAAMAIQDAQKVGISEAERAGLTGVYSGFTTCANVLERALKESYKSEPEPTKGKSV